MPRRAGHFCNCIHLHDQPPLPLSRFAPISWCALRGTLFAVALGLTPGVVLGGFDLQFTIKDSLDKFTPEQEQILQASLDHAEAMWEGVIVGYPDGVSVPSVNIEVRPSSSGLAAANFTSSILRDGIRFATAGFIQMNPAFIESFSTGIDPDGNFNTGLNYMDELMAHEAGHVLGVGTLWDDNDAYVPNSFQFTGEFALAAYRAEFDENSDGGARRRRRLGGHAGFALGISSCGVVRKKSDPSDPWPLSPLVHVVDPLGRDRALELMTGAIDPDYGEPFLKAFTRSNRCATWAIR